MDIRIPLYTNIDDRLNITVVKHRKYTDYILLNSLSAAPHNT